MTLRDANRPDLWADGSPRSMGTFHVDYKPDSRPVDKQAAKTVRDRTARARKLGPGLVDPEAKRSAVKHGGAHQRAKA
jgi:hypothetical protein